MTQTSKLYYSREDRIAEIHSEADRLQHDGSDSDKLLDLVGVVDDYCGQLSEKLEELLEGFCEGTGSPEDEEDINYTRRMVIERWALAQAAISKVGYVLRFDGNAAYERMINALKTGAAADMRGL